MQRMSRKAGKKSKSRTRAKSVAGSRKAPPLKTAQGSSARERFVKDLLVRGEAAKPDSRGKLRQDATHAITEESEKGTVKVKRVRYKYY